jgi:hypothetical protein
MGVKSMEIKTGYFISRLSENLGLTEENCELGLTAFCLHTHSKKLILQQGTQQNQHKLGLFKSPLLECRISRLKFVTQPEMG